MTSDNLIRHKGIVKSINDNEIKVAVISKSACISCNLKGVCNISEIEEKIIDVQSNQTQNFSVNETVDVFLKKDLGILALFLGYILPFILVITVLLTGSIFIESEAIYGSISLLVLVPYYLILYLKKNSLKTKFNFYIKKYKS